LSLFIINYVLLLSIVLLFSLVSILLLTFVMVPSVGYLSVGGTQGQPTVRLIGWLVVERNRGTLVGWSVGWFGQLHAMTPSSIDGF